MVVFRLPKRPLGPSCGVALMLGGFGSNLAVLADVGITVMAPGRNHYQWVSRKGWLGTGDLVIDEHSANFAGGHVYALDVGGAIFAPAVRYENDPFPLSRCESRTASASTTVRLVKYLGEPSGVL